MSRGVLTKELAPDDFPIFIIHRKRRQEVMLEVEEVEQAIVADDGLV